MVLKNLLNTVVLEIAKKNFKIKKVTMFDKNIYVSTIIDSYNYGTVLQAVATRDVLGPYGKPLFIDYCREAWTHEGLRDIYLMADTCGENLKNVSPKWLFSQATCHI